jgi:hypothetical protein
MTYTEAVEKAKANKGQALDFIFADAAKNLVGKTLVAVDSSNKNEIEIVEWVGTNYVIRINGGDDYNITPVDWALHKLNKAMKVKN